MNHPWLKSRVRDGAKEENEEDYRGFVIRDDCVDEHRAKSPPSANDLNIENIFFPCRPDVKLGFQDYCYIANDFYTHHIDEEAVKTVETFGYPRHTIIEALNKGDLNHATASYNLLTLS